MVLNVYKPKNWTSFDVVAKLRGSLKVKKIGHAGTLDPLAEGVLIVLTDQDTKRQDEFMQLEKEYHAFIAFGAFSPTFDLEQPLRACSILKEGFAQRLASALPSYIGEIEQTVPPFSAKKIDGMRMYKKARKEDIDFEDLPHKKVQISEIDVIGVTEKEVITVTGNMRLPVAEMKILCGKGTFIRSLAYDIGRNLDTCGVLLDLTRVSIGPYKIADSLKIEDIVFQNVITSCDTV